MKNIRARVWHSFAPVPAAAPELSDACKQRDLRLAVISAFGQYIAVDPPADEIRDVQALPHPKVQILDALCVEIALCEDEQQADTMMAAGQMLADFQEGGGSKPISQIGDAYAKIAGGTQELSQEDLLKLASAIAYSPDQDRYEQLREVADVELIEVRAKLMAANTMRRGMPPRGSSSCVVAFP